uniref:Uncharacterized protein n=1 Tax=Anguilla anguilla TaxID=7936 RepID=A0A0E9P533_ANGAN
MDCCNGLTTELHQRGKKHYSKN